MSCGETGHYFEAGPDGAFPDATDGDVSSHLSQRGFAFEEVRVLAALWWVKFGVEEGAAVGDGLQRGRTLVGEGETHKQLQRGKKKYTNESTKA